MLLADYNTCNMPITRNINKNNHAASLESYQVLDELAKANTGGMFVIVLMISPDVVFVLACTFASEDIDSQRCERYKVRRTSVSGFFPHLSHPQLLAVDHTSLHHHYILSSINGTHQGKALDSCRSLVART